MRTLAGIKFMDKILLAIFTVGLISCGSKDTGLTNEVSHLATTDTIGVGHKEENSPDTIKLAVLPPEVLKLLDKQNITPKGNYYNLKLSSDSTFVIEWSNGNEKRVTEMDFPLSPLIERFHLGWENDKFIALRAWTGSDWWFDLFLPLGSDSSEFSIGNVLTFDKNQNLVVNEYASADTIMAIHNLVSKTTQFIIEKNRCESALTHYCIDSIAFTKNGLYYRWTLPHKLDDHKKYFERKVVVKI
jgi:hypothetical protein